jgi:hypothetical protein
MGNADASPVSTMYFVVKSTNGGKMAVNVLKNKETSGKWTITFS